MTEEETTQRYFIRITKNGTLPGQDQYSAYLLQGTLTERDLRIPPAYHGTRAEVARKLGVEEGELREGGTIIVPSPDEER
jgi:hypothetical protein